MINEGLDDLLATREEAELKLDKIENNDGIRKRVSLLIDFMKSKSTGWEVKLLAGGALLYFITPWDAIPDWIPFGGYADDMIVLSATIGQLASWAKKFKTNA